MRFRISSATHADRVLALASSRGVVRAGEVTALGIPRAVLSRLVERGELLRVGRGLYTSPHGPLTEHHTLVEVAARVPGAVFNLLSALAFHGLTDELPHAVWIALARGSHRPGLDFVDLELTLTAPRFLELGVDAHEVEGRTVRVTSPARTVVDCFKFRSRVGLDVGLHALRDYLKQHHHGRTELWEMAGLCRVRSVLRPYLESMST